jgi:hypothetical protein
MGVLTLCSFAVQDLYTCFDDKNTFRKRIVLPTIKKLLKVKLSAVSAALGACDATRPIQAQVIALLENEFDDFAKLFEEQLRLSYAAEYEKKVKKVAKHYNSIKQGSFTRDTIVDFMKRVGGSDVNDDLHVKLCEYMSNKLEALQQLVTRMERHAVKSSLGTIERRYVLLLLPLFKRAQLLNFAS